MTWQLVMGNKELLPHGVTRAVMCDPPDSLVTVMRHSPSLCSWCRAVISH